MMKKTYLLPVMLAIASAGPALAQQAAAPDASAPQVAAPAASTKLEEVVVTAERQVSTVQKTAVAISVLHGDQLADITRAQNLTGLVPGLQIGQNGANTQAFVRGIGDTASNSRGQNSVPFVVDGVDLPRGSAVTPMFFDLERIEVLVGPQGTLYARNSSGGDFNLITRAMSAATSGITISTNSTARSTCRLARTSRSGLPARPSTIPVI